MKIVILALASCLLCTGAASAQTYEPIVPGSNYGCIGFSNGARRVGKGTPDGYKIIDEADARKNLQHIIDKGKAREEALTDLKVEVKSDRGITDQEIRSALKLVAAYEKRGNDDKPNPGDYIPRTRQEKIAMFNNLIARVKSVERATKTEIKALTTCPHKKPILPEGFLSTETVGTPGGIAVILWGKKKKFLEGNNYCVSGPGFEGIRVLKFEKNPCPPGPTSCVPKGFIGINVGGLAADHALTPDEITNYSTQATERSGGTYEVKLQKADKKGFLIPCEQIIN